MSQKRYGITQFAAISNFVNGLNIYLLSHAQPLHLKLPNKIWIAVGGSNENNKEDPLESHINE